MKIFDLLNKIANGEEVPKKIKYENKILYFDNEDNEDNNYHATFNYYDEEGNNELFTGWVGEYLNDEIEIIEENKKDKDKDKEIEVYINGEKVDVTDIYEPLKQGEYFYKENGKWYVHKLKNVSKIIEEDKKIEPLVLQNFTSNQKKIARKVNEIITYINKEE